MLDDLSVVVSDFTVVVYLSRYAGCAVGLARSFAVALTSTALAMAPAPTIMAPTTKATENPCTTAYRRESRSVRCDVVGGGGGGDGVEEGGAQGGTDLLGGVHHGAGDTGVSLAHLGQGGAAQSGEGQTEPEAHDDLLGKEVGPVRGVHPDLGQPQQTQGRHGKAGGDGDARSDLGQQVALRPRRRRSRRGRREGRRRRLWLLSSEGSAACSSSRK